MLRKEGYMKDIINLTDKVVLITGGSRGIGAAAAELCAQAGANVIINYNTKQSSAKAVVNSIKKHGQNAIAIQADIADSNQVNAMIASSIDMFGHIDVLVNNAGIWTYGAIADMDEKVWNETIQINQTSIFYCCRSVVPHMQRQKFGRIINISSTAGQRGEAFHSHYAASKGAIISFTKSLAAELAPDNILVNAVAPGWVDTDMTTQALKEQAKEIKSAIPLGRAGFPVEIAGAILFLASDLSSYITGEVINVNGGSVLCG